MGKKVRMRGDHYMFACYRAEKGLAAKRGPGIKAAIIFHKMFKRLEYCII